MSLTDKDKLTIEKIVDKKQNNLLIKLINILPTKDYLEENFIGRTEFTELKERLKIMQDNQIRIMNFLDLENELRYFKL